MEYPETFLRGVPNDKDFVYGVYPQTSLFRFETNPDREDDGYDELSINWEDDEKAVDLILCQQKKDKEGKPCIQFDYGYSRMRLSHVATMVSAHIKDGVFAYERRPVGASELNPENPYHGNLLFNREKKELKKLIQNALATLASVELVRRDG